MSDTDFDIAIIGAGVSGAAIAQKLSQFDVSVVVLEKHTDISFGVSKANSGIIHAGFHHKPETLKSKLEIKGNAAFDSLQKQLNFPFKRVGILVIAFSYQEMKIIGQLYDRGIRNNVPGIEICSREKTLGLEPKLNKDVAGSLYAPTGGIIEPYRFVFALIIKRSKHNMSSMPQDCTQIIYQGFLMQKILRSCQEKVKNISWKKTLRGFRIMSFFRYL